MKRFYTTPDVQILRLESPDVITASQNEEEGGLQADFFFEY